MQMSPNSTLLSRLIKCSSIHVQTLSQQVYRYVCREKKKTRGTEGGKETEKKINWKFFAFFWCARRSGNEANYYYYYAKMSQTIFISFFPMKIQSQRWWVRNLTNMNACTLLQMASGEIGSGKLRILRANLILIKLPEKYADHKQCD